MGNPIPPGDGLAPLVDKLGAQDRRLRELETFDASQYARAIDTLQEQQAYLAGLVTRSATRGNEDYTSIPGDSNVHYFDTDTAITLRIPTGRSLVSVSSTLVYVVPGNSAAEGFVTFSVKREDQPEPFWPPGFGSMRVWGTDGNTIGVGGSASTIINTSSATLDYTFRLVLGYRSYSSIDLARVRIDAPTITVQVIDAD